MGREAVVRSEADRKHTRKARVELGLVKRNVIQERSMAKAAVFVSRDQELASEGVRVCKATVMSCWEGCWAGKMARGKITHSLEPALPQRSHVHCRVAREDV